MEKRGSFVPLYLTNFFGVVNDNFLKVLVSLVIIGWVQDEHLHPVFTGAVSAALVLPYILFSPLADRLTALWSKRRILLVAKAAELPIVALAILGFWGHSIALILAAVLLMGLQSALYSPAKYALIRDIGGAERISTGMGGMEGIAFLGILAGTIGASFAADLTSMTIPSIALLAWAAVGFLCCLLIRAEEERNRSLHAINPLRYLRRIRRMTRAYPGLGAVIRTLSIFWFSLSMLQLGLLSYGTDVLRLDGAHTGGMLALAAIGIVSGQVIAGFIDRRHFLLGGTLLTGWLAAAILAVLFCFPLPPVAFAMLVGLLAFDLGCFKLPLDAEIQKVVKGPKLNTMLAYFNQVSFLFMFGSSVIYIAVSRLFGPRAFLLLLSLVMFVVPILFVLSYRSVLLFTGRWLLYRRYDVHVEDLAGLAEGQTLLVLPNHPAMVDPLLVSTTLWRTPVRPLVDEAFLHAGIAAPAILRTLAAVPVPDLRKGRSAKGASIARGLGDIVTATLAAGGNAILYPSGHLYTDPELEPARDGSVRYAASGEPREDIGTRQLAYNICRALPPGVRVIGVRTTGLWGSIWSRKGRKSTPSFVPTLLKAAFLWCFVSPFVRRRRVDMRLEDLTGRVTEWAKLTRLEFNERLCAWYNNETVGHG